MIITDDPIARTVRRNVYALLEERGMTVYRLGRLVGGDPNTTRIQLSRDGALQTSTIARWATALGVDPLELLTTKS